MHFVFLLLIFFIHVRPNEAILFMNFKKHYIFLFSHLLFGNTQCYICLLYMSYSANKGQIGCLDIIERYHLGKKL